MAARRTFAEILAAARPAAAAAAWDRARKASKLRHAAFKSGRWHASKRFAGAKADAVRRAVRLAGERVRVSIDEHYQVGMLSVHFRGRGRLHLPAGTPLPGA